MSQKDMMLHDKLIMTDPSDAITGGCSKYDAHQFAPGAPRGQLHRAFSVFLFNERGEMLITRRADTKITFPGVWTNTCCSHPIHGMTPGEVDENEPGEVERTGEVRTEGTKFGAVRKLKHEVRSERGGASEGVGQSEGLV
jgi:isopentenyl-diphosphate delta-isomerase